MAGLQENEIAELQSHLQHAVRACSDRGLWQSAKWAAELLNSLPHIEPDSPQLPIHTDTLLESRDSPKFLLAKSLFDCREFDRCAAVILPSTLLRVPVMPISPSRPQSTMKGEDKATGSLRKISEEAFLLSNINEKALFLALYAKYLSGEKRKEEDSEMILGPADGGVTTNKELNGIAGILEQWFAETCVEGKDDGGWLEYLYGIVLAKGKNEDLAKEWLIRSVNTYPFNWGAWQELSDLINSIEELDSIMSRLPQHIMAFIFHIYSSQELAQTTKQVHTALDQVMTYFPNSSFLKTQRALLYYHNKEFEESESIFSSLLHLDPFRVDFMDYYSYILYVMEARPKLAFLAQLATQTDKFRPETCCIVGNYYALNSEHEKAVLYFRRALQLDRNFLSAWTLMGYEYVEMKNIRAAIESFRRAVDISRKDYRAWYGLGQTYEVLEMHSYALFYYQRAASLRPYDANIWQAVGTCSSRVGKLANAIRAYKRALVAGSSCYASSSSSSDTTSLQALDDGVLDPESLYQIALLYERTDQKEECAAYMDLVLAQEEGGHVDEEDADGILCSSQSAAQGVRAQGVGVTPTTSKARMWLARWEFARCNYQKTMQLANELCQDGVDVEDAKALMRDVKARIESDGEVGGGDRKIGWDSSR